MEQRHDGGMLSALALGPATRLAVIDAFVHRDGLLSLAADAASIVDDGIVDPAVLRTTTSATGVRVLAVHTSKLGVRVGRATDIPFPRSYEAVLDSTLLADCEGLILNSGSSWIILTTTEVRSALTRRRRLATRAAQATRAAEAARNGA